MKKVIVSLLVTFCLLGMALIMLNERLETANQPTASGTIRPSLLPSLPEPGAGSLEGDRTPSGTMPPLPDVIEHPATVQPPMAYDAPPRSAMEDGSVVTGTVTGPEMGTASSDDSGAAPEAEHEARAERPDGRAVCALAVPVAPNGDAGDETHQEKAARAEAERADREKAAQERAAKERADQEKAARERAERLAREKAVQERAAGEKARQAKDDKARSKDAVIVIFAREKGATVRITGSQGMDYKHIVLSDPDRIVVDIAGIWNVQFPPKPPKNPIVTGIRTARRPDNQTRVVIELRQASRKPHFPQSKDKKQLDVRVDI